MFARSCFVLRIQQPPTIRLLDSTPHIIPVARSVTPKPNSDTRSKTLATQLSPAEPDLLASLSLSSKPVITNKVPVFGMPSLRGAVPRPSPQEDTDEMDWTPTDPSAPRPAQRRRQVAEPDDGAWLRPQKFFAPENPTGLEDLLQHTNLAEDVAMTDLSQANSSSGFQLPAVLAHWWMVCVLLILPVVAVVVQLWTSRMSGATLPDSHFDPQFALYDDEFRT